MSIKLPTINNKNTNKNMYCLFHIYMNKSKHYCVSNLMIIIKVKTNSMCKQFFTPNNAKATEHAIVSSKFNMILI